MAHPYAKFRSGGAAKAAQYVKAYAGGGPIKKLIKAVGDKYKDMRYGEKFTRDAEGKATGYNADRVYRDAGINPETGDALPSKLLRAGATPSPEFMLRNPIGEKHGGKVKRSFEGGAIEGTDAYYADQERKNNVPKKDRKYGAPIPESFDLTPNKPDKFDRKERRQAEDELPGLKKRLERKK